MCTDRGGNLYQCVGCDADTPEQKAANLRVRMGSLDILFGCRFFYGKRTARRLHQPEPAVYIRVVSNSNFFDTLPHSHAGTTGTT
jgi:hypothetical protein